jgi:NDP-sugar pyrophosphorylase family protein
MIERVYGKYTVRSTIIAGGFGKRLNACDEKKSVNALAKPACPAGNLRIIEFTLRALAQAGLNDWRLAVFHLPETIQRVIKNGQQYGDNVKVEYIHDSAEEPLDTAGSIAKIVHDNGWHENEKDLIVVPSADIAHNIPLEAVISQHIRNREEHNAVATIIVNPVPWEMVKELGTAQLETMPDRRNFQGDAEFEDAVQAWFLDNQGASRMIKDFREKQPRLRNNDLKDETERFKQVCVSNLNNSSLYIFNATIFKELFRFLTKKHDPDKNGPIRPLFPDLYANPDPIPLSDFGKQVFGWMIRRGMPVFAYVVPERFEDGTPSYWRDAGCGEQLRQLNMDILDGKVDSGLTDAKYHTATTFGWVGKNVFIHPSAKVNEKHRTLIGDNVVIEEGASLVHSNIGANTNVRAGAEIHGSVVFPKPLDRAAANEIGRGARLIDAVFTGGEVRPGAELRRKLYYEPRDGLGVASLVEETKLPDPI